MELTFGLDEIKNAATIFASVINGHKIFAFHGNLGSGKTTFITAVCDVLGVTDHVTSPTFSIIQTYQAVNGKIIYHLDLYRVKDHQEAVDAGVEDCLYSGELCFVEWPERVFGLFPADTVQVFIKVCDERNRHMTIKFP
ncbi:MAG: tRNA (adenosine(37)-N6)-threonylcarbamoyltransferase complex ATPase subunit type 1 TsaE [Ginsengibacter sp.]